MLVASYGFFYNAGYYKDALSDSSFKLLNTSGYFCVFGAISLLILILLNLLWKFNLKRFSVILLVFFLIGILNTMILVDAYKPYNYDREDFNKKDTNLNISLIGLDALSWDMIEPMMKIGYLPNLDRLRRHSSWGNIETLTPTKSNVIWTSIATGKKPVKHGIKSFFKYDFIFLEKQLEILPKNMFMMLFLNFKMLKVETVNAENRIAAPLWNITGNDSSAGTSVINWWSSIPADSLNGFDFSNFVYYMKAGYDREFEYDVSYPPSLSEYAKIFEVVNSSEAEQFIKGKATNERTEFIYSYIKDRIYREDELYFRIGHYFFRKYYPAFFFFYHNGTDPIAHFFTKYYNAISAEGIHKDEIALFSETMESYFDHVDSKISEFLKVKDENRVFMFLSDHGMVDTPPLVRFYRNRIVKNPYLYGYHDDAIKGFFMIAGTSINKDLLIDDVSVYDITPTLLYLAGYPVAEDMDGKVIGKAIDGNFQAEYPIDSIKTYNHLNRRRALEKKETIDDKNVIDKLKSLGYI